MAEKLFDKASYSLVRTNPKLTGNVKLVSNGTKLYLESFSANTELSSSTFKAFKINGKNTYDRDVWQFFQGGKFPATLAYEVFQEYQDVSVLSQYQNQYEMFYSAGTRSVASNSYSEDLGMLAPLWLNEQIPNNFVIFRIDNPAAINNINASLENENYLNAQTSTEFTKNVLENCTAIKTFDLTSNSLLGSYIRNYRNQESFPESPLNITWRKDEPIQWAGINYSKGGFTQAGSFSYDNLITQDTTIINNEFFFTEGFERNNVLLANLINMEFLFSDENAKDYSLNRYFGLYVNEVEEGLFDISGEGFYKSTEKTQLPNITSITEVSEQLNTPFEMTNDNGIVLYLDPIKTTTVTGLPTPKRVNEVESIFYVKDKNNDFHTIKKGSQWGENQIRLFDTKIDISTLTGFKEPDTYANASILQQAGKATAYFKISSELTDGFKITFYDGTTLVGEVAASTAESPNPGKNKNQFFNPTGTPNEIAIAITSAINQGISPEKRFFEATYNNDTVYVQSRFGGSRFNRLNFELNYSEYPLMINSIVTYPETSITKEDSDFVGGNDFKGSLLKVANGDQERFVKGNYVQSKDGFAEIGEWVPYLNEPIKSGKNVIGYTGVSDYVIITLNNNQIEVTRSGQVALYSDYRPSFGRFSIFPIRDFDYDFYSTKYSQLGELEFEEEEYNQTDANGDYINISANPEVRSFYDDGGFGELIGLLKNADPDISFDTFINSEYDRLQENYIKQQAIASRVIPYINKWSWLNDGKNVRNLPYSLNVNEAFGQNNFAPSKYSIGQDAQGFTHEWYYLCEFPTYFSNDAIKSSWSYIDNAPTDTIEANPVTGAVYTPGTFQKVDKDYFNDYFIVDKFTTNNTINLIDRQLRYGRFSGGDEKNFAETFLRGVRIIAKPKANPEDKPNFNARSLKYVNDGRFNDYRFSVIMIPNAPDKPITQVKFVKNDKWKTVVMMVFITLDNDCVNLGGQLIDRTTLYSFESDYLTTDCKPNISTSGGYEYNRGFVQGAISFAATTFDVSLGAYIIQGVPDINNNPTRFLRDLTIGSDGQFNTIRFTIPGTPADLYEIKEISRVISDTQFIAAKIEKNGAPFTPGGFTPTSAELRQTDYFTVEGGFNTYTSRLSDVGFATIFNDVNQGAPDIVYETIDKDGNRILDKNGNIAQTFSVELRAQVDILKSVYVGVLPDPAKPTVFNLTDVIGYDLSLQTQPRITPIGRHAGYYEPTSIPILSFRDPYLEIDFDSVTGSTGTGSTGGSIPDELYKYKVKELCRYENTQFNSSDVDNFGQIKNLFYHKVNEEDPSTVLELSTDSAYLSLYPLINEVGIAKKDFYIWSSNWEPAYFRKSIDKSQIESVIGTRAMTEKKSFFGSKYLKVPQQIELETFLHSPFLKGAIKQPTLIDGTFMTEENETSVKFYTFIQKRLIEFLSEPIKEEFKKFIKPEFSFADIETLDDDVERYITQNVLQLYKISNVDFYVKSSRETTPLNYSTAQLTNSEKAAAGLTINTAVGSKLLNNNPFDLSLIYNKRKGFTESFGFSITIVKK